ncbi:hypothetical protein RJ640_004354 [Escallonia rubra]|uniref:AAA+ ATPase domain-containing protein n=1 Tax=Escallonia rubra TaxID=112253 RepID=A0AA88RC33_9ASTE|nr:hypothetical protein RJ640_004352 [Escallonia rubra]KAK2986598.1 hypothetical protein RJ640_004354 [Escallonia rubra]
MALRKMPSAKTLLSTAASVAASAMLIRTITNDFLPDELRDYFSSGLRSVFHYFSSQFTIVIEEFRGLTLNQVFEAADIYLGTKVTPSTQRVRLGKSENEKDVAIRVDKGEEIIDVFQDIQVKWVLICTQVESNSHRQYHSRDMNATLRSEVRSYELSFHKKDKDVVLSSYLPYVLQTSRAMMDEVKAIQLHTVNYGSWDSSPINVDHPMTFQTLALDSELKNTIVEDLDNFVNGKEFYRRVGKAWKRGYLLYGPPGTGKTSLVAAMANYLNYDIYDLDLTDVECNADLRSLLLSMSNRSILVIEDIDCTIKLQNREAQQDEPKNQENKVTLSGLLNFIDGLWSCCGDARIIIFTTNHKDRLDPALLRPGRMDMHIHMSYCTFSAFKQLASNYLGISDHSLFGQIEGLLKEAEVTPADVAGELMKNTNKEVSLPGLLVFLKNKIAEKEQEQAKNGTEEDQLKKDATLGSAELVP